MNPHLTPQDKLALALTSAGSVRRLAGAMGISHQKLGRWLREGEPGGVKQIPDEARGAINSVYALHKEIARDQAKADKLPFFPDAPVYAYRPLMRNGQKGERMVVPATEFFSRDMRMLYLAYAHNSGKFWGVSIRSVIDWYTYIMDSKPVSSNNYVSNRDGTVTYKPTGEVIDNTIAPIYTKKEDFSESVFANKKKRIYTPAEDFRKGSPGWRSISGIEEKLSTKHQLHSVHFADEFLMQLAPEGIEHEKRFDKRASDAATSNEESRRNGKPAARRKRWSNKRGK